MGDGGRNPDGPEGGNDPRTFFGADGHDAVRGVDELIAIVEVKTDDVGGRIVARVRDDPRAAAGKGIEDCRLTLFRHLLSKYRKRAGAATTTLNL